MRQKVQYEAVEGFRREAPNVRKAPSLKFYDELALFVTLSHNGHSTSSHIKQLIHSYTFKFEKVVSESARYLLKDAN